MSEAPDHEDKTEEPTEKRLHDAIERGQIAFSREAPLFASLAATLVALVYLAPAHTQALVAALTGVVADPGGWRLDRGEDALALLVRIALAIAAFLGPIVVLLMAAGLVASFAQAAPRVVPDRILPDWSRISLRAGLRRMFGLRGVIEFAKNLAKISAVGGAAGLMLWGERTLLTTAMDVDPNLLPGRALTLAAKTVAAVLVAAMAIAAADIVWSQILWRRDQRMTREEVKDELKQAEGDRFVKARLRSLRMDRARRRMLSAVPRATMVVVNPTHYAVAMRWVRSEGGAPTVVAKGVDLIALKIREIAEAHAIPVVEDKPLARSLYTAVDVDRPIPSEFYRAVAEIVHLIQKRTSAWTRK